MVRLLKPDEGIVYLDGKAISRMPTIEVARRLAILPQSSIAPTGLGELVEQRRYPHAGPLRMLRRQDHQAIEEALTLTGLTTFRQRALDTLSGGERQRAWIALALAQATHILFLDEPTTFLDIGHQLEVLHLVQRLNRERGITIVMALHDLNQAARFANTMVVLKNGKIVKQGKPADILNGSLLAEAFAVQAYIVRDPVTNAPFCIPYGSLPE
ncbi:ABC transporter ATP-binding protein [Ktedonosporobacter rubrisoli]|uniref:ABC transporter ATP-binding protein n=1 Tax=Ktedonosporobacter rubrisoli TaxID=2509675 RepID=UPI001F5D0BDD|nr:ABC transporter ATP-binding protein [Ktedonosporobacter rubrisoli]